MMPLLLAFSLGLLAGANGVGLLAVGMHRRLVETLRQERAEQLRAARRKAYSQGYEARAALEFAARQEGG